MGSVLGGFGRSMSFSASPWRLALIAVVLMVGVYGVGYGLITARHTVIVSSTYGPQHRLVHQTQVHYPSRFYYDFFMPLWRIDQTWFRTELVFTSIHHDPPAPE